MIASNSRFFALCVEDDPVVRRNLLRAFRRRFHAWFEPVLTEDFADRTWARNIPPVDVALIHVPDKRRETMSRLARLRSANPDLPIVVSTCYDGDYQLAADQLEALAQVVVFRPFDAAALVVTLRGLCEDRINTGVH